MNVEDVTVRRSLFLNRLYDAVGKNDRVTIRASELANKLGVSRDEWPRIVSYLHGERLIRWAAEDHIAITQQGIQAIETSRLHPEEPTGDFPPYADVIRMGQISGPASASPLTPQGAVGSVPGASPPMVNRDELAGLVEMLRASVAEFGLPAEDTEQLNAETTALEAYARSPKPNAALLNEALKSIHAIVEGATGSPAASEVLTSLGRMIH